MPPWLASAYHTPIDVRLKGYPFVVMDTSSYYNIMYIINIFETLILLHISYIRRNYLHIYGISFIYLYSYLFTFVCSYHYFYIPLLFANRFVALLYLLARLHGDFCVDVRGLQPTSAQKRTKFSFSRQGDIIVLPQLDTDSPALRNS